MRILRLAVLRSYLILSKNVKKSLVAINIGIFLSVFAATAAIISLYIENKISEAEFLLIENQQEKINQDLMIKEIPAYIDKFDQAILGANSHNQKNEFLKFTDFGNKIVSVQDMYLPYLYDLELIREILLMPQIKGMNDIIKEELSSNPEAYDEDVLKEYLNLISELEKHIENPLDTKNITKYKKRLFHASFSDLMEEIQYANKHLKGADDYFYENIITSQFIETYNIMLFLKEYFLMLEDMMRGWGKGYSEITQEINDKIIKLSEHEKNLIFIAFFLQLIIFIIIQFFEISSVVSHNIKKKAKK
jgi:hypothetical protein|tara:strand:+ start:1851 stop:2765 length:915 start_codon:yes stop_codon:yes gene_type:complete